jgi:hypothetical protein
MQVMQPNGIKPKMRDCDINFWGVLKHRDVKQGLGVCVDLFIYIGCCN